RPGPPSREWVAVAEARNAPAESTTRLGEPVDPEVSTSNAAGPFGSGSGVAGAVAVTGSTAGPPSRASPRASTSRSTDSRDPSTTTVRTGQYYQSARARSQSPSGGGSRIGSG